MAMLLLRRHVPGLDRSSQISSPFRHQQRSGSTARQPRRSSLGVCASRQERQTEWDPATPNAAPQRSSSTPSASGEYSVANVSASVDVAASQSADDSAHLIGEDGVEVEALFKLNSYRSAGRHTMPDK